MSLQKLLKARIAAVFAMLFVCVGMSAQTITVKGTVKDANGEPVVAAGVLIKGTTNGVTTNLDGEYTIQVSSRATLSFEALGFKHVEVPVQGKNVIDVVLSDDSERLDASTVTAEFGMKRVARSIGSSVQSVKSSDIVESGRESFTSALQGRVAGMTVTTTGGAPGSSTSIVLRSATSISGNNQPLFVVDGIPVNNRTVSGQYDFAYDDAVSMYNMDFSSRGNDLNPDDIESMTVLKGAAAAALYGSDASNGAIIITTKKGAAGKGKVTYSNSFRWDKSYGFPGIQTKYANGAYGTTNMYYTSRYGAEYPDGIALYDNISPLLQTGFSQTHNISAEGGTDKFTLRGAFSYTDQTGVIKTTDYQRMNITLSGRAEITKWLNIEGTMQYVKTGNTKAQKGLNGVLYRAVRWPLFDDITNFVNSDGTMRYPDLYTDTDLFNPMFALYKNVNHDSIDRAIGNMSINIKPSEHTFIRANYGIDFSVGEYKVYTHPYFANATSASYGSGSMNYSKPTYRDQTLNVLVGYNNEWEDFTLGVQVGYHQQENGIRILSTYGDGLKMKDNYSLANCTSSSIMSRTRTTVRRIQAFSGQAELGYKNMAFLTLRARNDWSSTLPTNNNHYFYPAVEGSFVATELPMMKNQDAVSYLKLRGAIAQVGKDADPLSINPALEATEDWGGGFRYGYTGPNPELKPEMTTSYEIGFEGRFLNDRINTDFTYFWTKCENQYVKGFRLSYATGYVLNNMNVGTFTTNGFEFHIDGDILRTLSGFRWNLGLNLSHSTSKVTYLPPAISEYYDAYTWLSGNLRNGISLGNPITTMTGHDYQRNDKGQILISPSTGLPLVSDQWTIMGDRQPKLEFGITTAVSYKNFRLSALVNGRLGATVVNATKRDMLSTGSSWESVALRESGSVVLDGVLKDGLENTDNPTPNNIAIDMAAYGTSVYTGTDINWLEKNVNYLRLSELRLSYTVPQNWLRKVTNNFVNSASVYVKGNDLVTLTNYSGIDPVGNANSASMGGVGGVGIDFWGLPSPRGFGFGINLTF